MGQWPALNHQRDFRGVELLFGVVIRIPVNLDLRQVFDRIVKIVFDSILNRLLVMREETCDRPSMLSVNITLTTPPNLQETHVIMREIAIRILCLLITSIPFPSVPGGPTFIDDDMFLCAESTALRSGT
jgi:hypothetical protein